MGNLSNIYSRKPILELSNKSQKEITDFFKYLGMYCLGKEEVNRIVKNSSDPKGIRSAIKKIHQNSIVRYKDAYNKFCLLRDVKKQLVYMMTKSNCLDLKKGLSIEKHNIL